MKNLKISLLPFAVIMLMHTNSYAEGFIEDSKFDIMNRNFYFNRDFRNGASNPSGANSKLAVKDREGYRSEWAQGLVVNFSSGFTDTLVQLGFDAYAMGGLKLYSDEMKTGTNLIPFDPATGETKDAFGELGGAIKLKYKDTVVKYGDQFPNLPVLAVSTVRLLPSTATGLSVNNRSFNNLDLNLGYFYRMSPVDSHKFYNFFTTDYASGIKGDSISYVGGSLNQDNTTYVAYASQFKNVWNQYYLGGNTIYNLAKDGHQIKFNTANYYNKDTGSKRGGDIDVVALSALLGYKVHNHTFSLGYQQIIGDEPFDWIAFTTMGANISILNAAQFSTFSEANEKSVQIKYEVELAKYGLNGFGLMARYLYGWDMDNTRSNNAFYTNRYVYDLNKNNKHWERDITLSYKVPTGFAKGLDIKLRQATHRATKGYRYNDIDELRVILEYPLSF